MVLMNVHGGLVHVKGLRNTSAKEHRGWVAIGETKVRENLCCIALLRDDMTIRDGMEFQSERMA